MTDATVMSKTMAFLEEYEMAMSNPAPVGDGGTTNQEIEDLLYQASGILMDIEWCNWREMVLS